MVAAQLSQWREDFLAGGQLALPQRHPDLREEQLTGLQAKVGELTREDPRRVLYRTSKKLALVLPQAGRSPLRIRGGGDLAARSGLVLPTPWTSDGSSPGGHAGAEDPTPAAAR